MYSAESYEIHKNPLSTPVDSDILIVSSDDDRDESPVGNQSQPWNECDVPATVQEWGVYLENGMNDFQTRPKQRGG